MKTLYEQNPESWEKLARAGKPSLGEMAKHFHLAGEMDTALGLNGAAGKWLSGANGATSISEAKAAAWLESRQIKEQPEKSGAVTFLCIADAATFAKAEKVLGLLGCEVVEI